MQRCSYYGLEKTKEPICVEPGCYRDVYSKRLCRAHYLKRYRLGQEMPKDTYEIVQCTRPVTAKGLCEKHYRKAVRNPLMESER